MHVTLSPRPSLPQRRSDEVDLCEINYLGSCVFMLARLLALPHRILCSRSVARSVHLLCNAIVNKLVIYTTLSHKAHVGTYYADSAHTGNFASVTRPFPDFLGGVWG